MGTLGDMDGYYQELVIRLKQLRGVASALLLHNNALVLNLKSPI